MQLAWEAIALLGWTGELEAGDHLLELMGSERLSVILAAEKALFRWFSSRSEARQRRWLAGRLKSSYRPANGDEVQRYAHLTLLAGQDQKGQRLLRGLVAEHSGRVLTAGYLLAIWSNRRTMDGALPHSLIQRLHSAARMRMKWLIDAFPAELHLDSLSAATLAERELFALHDAVGRIAEELAEGPRLRQLSREVASLLQEWQGALLKLGKGYRPARPVEESPEVRRHEVGRPAALAALRRINSPIGREVATAVCRLAPPRAGCDAGGVPR
jgi:hypothetical protein